MKNFHSFIVYQNNGFINHEMSIAAFADELMQYEDELSLDKHTIGIAVNAIFDTHMGKRLASPYVIGEVLKSLNAQPENYQDLLEKVQNFLRVSLDFNVVKGKGGGWARLCDV